MSPKPSLYDELCKYANRHGVTIIIDSDALSPAAIQHKAFVFDEDKNQLIIAGINLKPKDEDDIIKFLVENQNEGVDILDTEQEEIIDNYEGYSDTYNPYKDTIQLFFNVIPKRDYWALKMAYYMRIKNENGDDIKDYRRQIRERFGFRGLYISNLCNSGYYEGGFRSTYHRLDIAKFREYYELRVGLELAAIFVHNGMTEKSLTKLIKEKIALCAKNGLFKFRVHAMGGENVDLVKNLLSEYKELDLGMGMDVSINTISEAHNHPVFIDVEIEIL
jgi:hypothetical protein